MATEVMPLKIFDCECWYEASSLDTKVGSLRIPDLTIPFLTRAEFGLGAFIAKEINHRLDFRTKFAGEMVSDGLGPQTTLAELLKEKGFFKDFTCTSQLSVTLSSTNDDNDPNEGDNVGYEISGKQLHVDGSKVEVQNNKKTKSSKSRSTTKSDADYNAQEQYSSFGEKSYFSLSISNVPTYTVPKRLNKGIVRPEPYEPSSSAPNPQMSSLEVISISKSNGNLEDLIKKKEKKDKDIRLIFDQMRTQAKVHPANEIDIKSSQKDRMPFIVALDGRIYGPFFRVRIRPCRARIDTPKKTYEHEPFLEFPAMTFLPCNHS